MKYRKRTLEERLLAKIDKESLPGHWLWTGTFNPSRPKPVRRQPLRTIGQPGYVARRMPVPVIIVNGKQEQAVRLIWKLFKNPELPEGVYVRKVKTFCTWWQCVNPDCHDTPPRRLPRSPQMAVVPPSQMNKKIQGVGSDSDIQELADEIEGRFGRTYHEMSVDQLHEAFQSFARFEIIEACRILEERN